MSTVEFGVKRTSHHVAVTLITLDLSAPGLSFNRNSVHKARYLHQLQYEPQSAKCFIYRTQMHMQHADSTPSKTLPEIKNAKRKGSTGETKDLMLSSEAYVPRVQHLNHFHPEDVYARKTELYSENSKSVGFVPSLKTKAEMRSEKHRHRHSFPEYGFSEGRTRASGRRPSEHFRDVAIHDTGKREGSGSKRTSVPNVGSGKSLQPVELSSVRGHKTSVWDKEEEFADQSNEVRYELDEIGEKDTQVLVLETNTAENETVDSSDEVQCSTDTKELKMQRKIPTEHGGK